MKLPVFCYLLFVSAVCPLNANDWPTWRGPNGDGKLPDDATYPTEWSAGKNLRWKTDLEAPGNSSVIVSGGRIFMTSAENGGRVRSLLCFDTETGKPLWKKSVEYGKEEPTHKTNPFEAASPVTDGETVFAWHGNAGLWAYDFDGHEKWHRDLGDDYAHQWGANAPSPVLFRGALIVHAGPGSAVRLFALDKSSGKTLWEKELPDAVSADFKDFKGSWSTPFVVENDGRAELLLGLPKQLTSFDPKNGDELWRVAGLGDLCYTNVLTGDGKAVYLSGFGGPGIGITRRDRGKPETSQNRTVSGPIRRKGKTRTRSGSVRARSWATTFTCSTSRESSSVSKWQRANRSGRIVRSQELEFDEPGRGKTLRNDASATTFVIDPDPEALKVVATNPLGDRLSTNSSLAFADGRIYLRTDQALFAIGDR